MPVILVVDDSSVDRTLIGQLAAEEELDWIVEFADSAEEALVRLDEFVVDVVVTDMMMPGMDGLALLSLMRKKHSKTPVILTTGKGSEALAAEALRSGASSYVPKTELATRLKETIKQVLQLEESKRNYNVLIESVADTHFQFNLDNDPRLIAPLVDLVQELSFGMKLCGEQGRRRIGVALDEALINAMYHGNLQLPAEQLNDVRERLRDGKTVDEIECRKSEAPYCDRRVFVDVQLSPEKARITVRDDGCGFDQASEQNATNGASLQGDSSRGLVLIRNLMDSVEINQSGNEITMQKHREIKSRDPADESLAID